MEWTNQDKRRKEWFRYIGHRPRSYLFEDWMIWLATFNHREFRYMWE